MLKQNFRILLKYKRYTGFSLVGLSVAITSVWFIASYVISAYGYDRFHEKANRIYRVTMEVTAGDETYHYATTGIPLGTSMSNYNGVGSFVSIGFHNSNVKVKEQTFRESGVYQANAEALSVFSFDFLHGSQSALSQPNNIILSESLATKYFGQADALGKQLVIGEKSYNVGGVFRDWPENSHLEVNLLIAQEMPGSFEPQDWFNLEYYTYVLLEDAATPDQLSAQLVSMKTNDMDPFLEGSGIDVKFQVEPLKNIYFSTGLVDDVNKGNVTYVHLLVLAGLLILVISSLNFINLTLTRSTQRTKEIRLKKILGISQQQLLIQSGWESFVLTFAVTALAALAILIGDNYYLNQTGFSSFHIIKDGPWIFLLILLVFSLGLVGSSYTGVYLSFAQSSSMKEGKRVGFLKNVMLGFQYCIATVILVLTFTLEQQMNFIQNKDLGFNEEEVVIVGIPEVENGSAKGLLLREQLQSQSAIQSASLIGGGALPGEENAKDVFQVAIAGSRSEKLFNIYRVDEHYFNLLSIPFASGRNFDPEKADHQSVIINQTLAQSMGWEDPIGKRIWYGEDDPKKVIGVVKNFHNQSLHNLIEPIVFLYDSEYAQNLLVKTQPASLSQIELAWHEFYQGEPFDATFFDQFIAGMYAKEKQMTGLFRWFAITALLLCLMGLFALFSMHALQRVKEMSIRKVLGATALHLIKTVGTKYGIVLLTAQVVAFPLAWYLANELLAEFTYRTNVGIGLFMVTTVMVLSFSLVAVLHHLRKLLTVNPAETLKNE